MKLARYQRKKKKKLTRYLAADQPKPKRQNPANIPPSNETTNMVPEHWLMIHDKNVGKN